MVKAKTRFLKSRLLSVAAALLLSAVAGWGQTSLAQEEAELASVPVKATGGAWTPQGPAPVHNAQVENITDRPISGAIEAVVAHPTDPDVLWIGAVNGGIFRTDNATAASPRWMKQTDAQASLSIAALELDPTDPSFNTLVAGIGRTSSFAGIGGPRTGLLRTTDGGNAWTPLSTGLTGKNITGVAPRGAIIVVSADFADSFTAANIGIFRSIDSGATFTQVPGVMAAGVSAYDLVGDPTNNSRLFTIVRDRTGAFPGNSGIYRSTDTGATWTKVSNATQDTLINTPITDSNLAVGNAGPIVPNMFAAFCTSGRLAAGGLFRTGDASVATPVWTALDTPSTTEQFFSFGIHPGGQCGTHLSLVADPTNHDVVFIGGDRQPSNDEGGPPGVQFPNSIDASNFGGRLFRVDASQTPGGQATPITNCPTASAACGGAVRTVNDTAPHADSREMVFDANGDLLETDDGGIYRHTDPNGSTGDWVSVIGDLPVNEQHDGLYDTVSDILFTGNQDNGTTRQPNTGDYIWTLHNSGDGGDVAVAEDHPAIGQSTRYSSSQFLFSLNRQVFDATNTPLSLVFPALDATPFGDPAPAGQFVTPIAVNAVTPTNVALGDSNGIYLSTDQLNTVDLIFAVPVNFLGGGGPLVYGATNDAAAFYYASGDDVVSLTTAFGAWLSDPHAGSTENTVGVVMDPANAATAFAIDSDQVFQTINGGSTSPWTEITGNLQTFSPGTLHSIEYVPSASGDGLVVGGTAGVFRALEGTGFTTWDRLATLPNAPVYQLDYDPVDDVLAAGTLGRGTWTLHSASLQIHNLCNETLNLTTGAWKQISLACNPGGANTVADVFGDDLTGTYDSDWVVWRHDAATQSNVKLAPTDPLAIGEGYWIKTRLTSQSVDVSTTVNTITDVALVTSTADPPAGCASSAGRCGMVGHPGTYETCWADVQVIDNTTTLSLSEADPAGACQGVGAAGNGCVMSRIAHKWMGASYAPFDGKTLGMEGTIVPWDGFWVSAVKSGIKLRIPAIGGNCGAPARNVVPAGWYIRLIAESGNLRDASNVLGQLSDSALGYDAHDLEELSPFGSPFLTVVFPHDDWGEKSGAYSSDYHSPRPEGISDGWRFEVRSSEVGATVTLRWEGPDPRLLGSVLLDEETGQQVAVEPDGSYSFTLSGTSRGFQWTLPGSSDLIFADGFESGDTSKW